MWQSFFVCLFILCYNPFETQCLDTDLPVAQQVSNHIYLDVLAANYLTLEKSIWVKIRDNKMPKAVLLRTIYDEHKRVLSTNFQEAGVIWKLGIKEYRDVIDKILSINSTTSNALEHLNTEEYDLLTSLSKNTIKDMEKSVKDLYEKVDNESFWKKIIANVSN